MASSQNYAAERSLSLAESNPYQAPPDERLAEPPPKVRPAYSPVNRSRKRNCLIFLLAVASLSGLALPIVAEMSEEASTVPAMFLTFSAAIQFIAGAQWIKYDAQDRGFELWRNYAILMVFCPGPVVMFPIYFLRSMGVLRGLLATFLAACFATLLYAILFAGSMLVTIIMVASGG